MNQISPLLKVSMLLSGPPFSIFNQNFKIDLVQHYVYPEDKQFVTISMESTNWQTLHQNIQYGEKETYLVTVALIKRRDIFFHPKTVHNGKQLEQHELLQEIISWMQLPADRPVKLVPSVCNGAFIRFDATLEERKTSKLKLSSLSESFWFY